MKSFQHPTKNSQASRHVLLHSLNKVVLNPLAPLNMYIFVVFCLFVFHTSLLFYETSIFATEWTNRDTKHTNQINQSLTWFKKTKSLWKNYLESLIQVMFVINIFQIATSKFGITKFMALIFFKQNMFCKIWISKSKWK